MKRADLYIRVSTDEQADKGYSQRNQEEQLRRYCSINSIQVRRVVFEDHSAKSFNRPAWKELFSDLKKKRSNIDLLLFTKWDRFSRNTADAYQMISILTKLGIDPQAIEQPLDLSIPENKMMLAFYLAVPEVENDRRALNVFHGMRRAKKEGRWMGGAPIGYINRTREDGKKYIMPHEKEAPIIKWAFEQLATANYPTQQVLKKARQMGLKCSKNNFWVAVRNPVYCGKIFIPKFKDEESRFVEGQHEAIISTDLFYQAQDAIDGRKKHMKTKITVRDEFPLRGYLKCPGCGKMLTASASKGKRKYYNYYHCTAECGWRYSAETINGLFIDTLKEFTVRAGRVEVYEMIIAELYKKNSGGEEHSKSIILRDLDLAHRQLSKARMLLVNED